ncbi:MAG: 4Fe-4S binding protein [Myxococcales bacterium]|nr:4Fe-4S binding protein [Myxococcales bacterium]
MTGKPSRRDLFGWLPGRAHEPAKEFSLDELYAKRKAAPAPPMPHFRVFHDVEPVKTSSIGTPNAPPIQVPRPVARPFAGVARVRPDACLAYRSFCSACAERCPVPAAIVVDALGRPRVDESLCNGCGVCLTVCPAPVLAFEIVEVDGG